MECGESKIEVQATLSTPSSRSNRNDALGGLLSESESPPVDSCNTITTSVFERGRTSWPVSTNRVLITPSFSTPAFGCLIRSEFTLGELPKLIETIFACKDVREKARSLCRDEAQAFIDVMDEVLSTLSWKYPVGFVPTQTLDQALDRPDLELALGTRETCLKQLYRTCGYHELLPKALKIPICYNRIDIPLYRGGYADVWKGEYCGQEVAVKVIRTYSNSDLQRIVGVSDSPCSLSIYPRADNALRRGFARRS
jgi:hypothetical protein